MAGLEDSLDQPILRMFDMVNYQAARIVNGPRLYSPRHYRTRSDKVSCRFLMKTNPTSYALVCQSKLNENLGRGHLVVYTDIVLEDGRYQISPPGVKLSDEHVYMVTKHLLVKELARILHDYNEDDIGAEFLNPFSNDIDDSADKNKGPAR
ncbi:hypothetical protein PoHVEF18_004327 [Penicillium ochrochloron]